MRQPRASTPSKVMPVELDTATPRWSFVMTTLRNTMLDELERKSKPSGTGTLPTLPNTLPPSRRLVLPMIETGFVATPESCAVRVTAFVAV